MSVRVGSSRASWVYLAVRVGLSFESCGSHVMRVGPSAARPETHGTKPHDTKERPARTDTNRKIIPSIPTRTDTNRHGTSLKAGRFADRRSLIFDGMVPKVGPGHIQIGRTRLAAPVAPRCATSCTASVWRDLGGVVGRAGLRMTFVAHASMWCRIACATIACAPIIYVSHG